MKKVLIIKLGYSETLNPEISRECSLGDVLRTTVILNYLKKEHVSWLVDEKALPLLKDNPYIHRILLWNLESALQLRYEHFDWVINLEKSPGICALMEDITCWGRSGFRFDYNHGVAQAHNDAEKVLAIAQSGDEKKDNTHYWQEHLAHLIRRKWKPEHGYILKRRKILTSNDIGMNFQVGGKWGNKAWSITNWHRLGDILTKAGYKVSWQEGQEDLYNYMDWIASCRCLVTCDSLGLHIALAYDTPVVGLFGPSAWNEVYVGKGKIVHPHGVNCAPCFQPECTRDKGSCMNDLDMREIVKAVEEVCPSQ